MSPHAPAAAAAALLALGLLAPVTAAHAAPGSATHDRSAAQGGGGSSDHGRQAYVRIGTVLAVGDEPSRFPDLGFTTLSFVSQHPFPAETAEIIEIAPGSKIRRGGSTVPVTDLQPGDVAVIRMAEWGGTWVALNVHARTPGPPHAR